MKLLLLSFFVYTSAMAADTKTSTTEAVNPSSPKQACELLAKAAVDNNFKTFTELSAMPMMMDHDGKECAMEMHGNGKECTEKNCAGQKGLHKGKGKGHMKGGCEIHGMYGMRGMHGMFGMFGMHGMNPEESFKKMHEKEMDHLKSINCKDEKVVGDHAWVEASSKDESRLIPFKMIEGKWKFDMRTYHSFYHSPNEMMEQMEMMKK